MVTIWSRKSSRNMVRQARLHLDDVHQDRLCAFQSRPSISSWDTCFMSMVLFSYFLVFRDAFHLVEERTPGGVNQGGRMENVQAMEEFWGGSSVMARFLSEIFVLHDTSTFAVWGLKMESQLLGRFIACFLLRWFSLRTVEGLFCGNGNNITEGGWSGIAHMADFCDRLWRMRGLILALYSAIHTLHCEEP